MADRFPDCDAREMQHFKENDDEWGAVDDNQQFPRLSSDHNYQLSQKFPEPRCNVPWAELLTDSSVGWVSDNRAEGRGFEPWPDQHLGSLIN